MALSLVRVRGREISRIPAIIGWLRSSSSSVAAYDPTGDEKELSLGSREGSDDEIKCMASYVTTRIDEIVKFGKPPLPYVYAAEVFVDEIHGHSFIPEAVRFRILSKVAHFIQNIPEVDNIQVLFLFCQPT